ncbi:pilus assembly protein PilL [Mergibacter septicus]|uniref:Pilus assembly protein PilL n=1 Tax=Mergibacter septicus TaxID=221402 RepID=A0A8E3MEV9_9PAST|nr:pilus assembly protein PilL [Mergibacter septicus]AWX14706.1 pilus assembly protein PilL [Mergibacter septicus]QDJ13957.1 pilus assembly protein PilL [Mergibacter septicus]UTU48594.1 pilus assembly protein PilL [Mergibacter septicus]WMR95778.1 pilus assembly protein PilL [Mergibacter septicus]
MKNKKLIFLISTLAFSLTACTTTSVNTSTKTTNKINTVKSTIKPANHFIEPDLYKLNKNELPEVVRFDRYTLVSTAPLNSQKYLLDQLVHLNLNIKRNYSVETGLKMLLKNSGFSLCQATVPDVRTLYSHPLPKIHYKFGPMRLRNAVQMLAGNAYQASVNDVSREICFHRRLTTK